MGQISARCRSATSFGLNCYHIVEFAYILAFRAYCSVDGLYTSNGTDILRVTGSDVTSIYKSVWFFSVAWKRMKVWNVGMYTVSQKTSHLWLAITLTHMNGFWYFFGRNVTDKVGNQKTLYYATWNTCAFALPVKTGKHENHIFHSIGLCYTHNAPGRFLPEIKKNVICDVFDSV